MHVFLPVYFTAPLGGVQSQVRAHVRGLMANGHRCTVLARPGPFAEGLAADGATILETDWGSFGEPLAQARRGGEYDLVHAHPSRSREVGLEIAREQRLPFVLTLHGTYLDGLPAYAPRVDAVAAVSGAARDNVVAAGALDPERVVVIPNGVETDRFQPGDRAQLSALASDLPGLDGLEDRESGLRILLVTRLDADKQAIIDAVEAAWLATNGETADRLLWLVAGDGKLRDRLEAAARAMEARTGRRSVAFLGWQSESALVRLYRSADVTIAPGRCVLESLACGTPALAVGSRGYTGPVLGELGLRALYGNFGGFAGRARRPDDLLPDLLSLVGDAERLAEAGEAALELVRAFYRQDEVDLAYQALYGLLRNGRPRARAAPHAWRDLDVTGLALGAGWERRHGTGGLELTFGDDGLVADCALGEDRHEYLTRPPADLDRPPAGRELAVGPNRLVQLVVPLQIHGGAPDVRAWLIEYAGERRVGHRSARLAEGETRIATTTGPATTQVRVALRLAGSGRASIGPLRLLECAPA